MIKINIEEEVFKKAKIDFDKIVKYGFKKDDDGFKYFKNIRDNTFRVDVLINKEGLVKVKVFDLAFRDEYTNFRIEKNMGSFASKVKEEVLNILNDIKNNCFIKNDFRYEQTNRIANEIRKKYDDEPEFKWEEFPGYAIFKNKESNKWYGLIMNLDKNKLDKNCKGEVEIINIKLKPEKIEELLKLKGFYPAYHMNKKSWISIILDETIKDENIMDLIADSYSYTVINKRVKNTWLIPANPKYFDIEEALKKNNTIRWKQSTDIKIDDIVYLYVGSPYSSIMYKFKVKEVNIPYEYKKKNLKIKRVMKISLITRYEKGKLSFKKLKEYGIKAVRGPRYMPSALEEDINKIIKI